MKCARCRRTLNGPEQSKAKIEYENGKIKHVLHYKCWTIYQREAMLQGQQRVPAPTAYEAKTAYQNADDLTEEARVRRVAAELRLANLKALRDSGPSFGVDMTSSESVSLDELIEKEEQLVALAVRQEELAEDSAEEPRPEQWNDIRDPTTLEL